MARIKSADEIQQLRAVIKVIGLGLSVLALLFAFRPKRFWAAESRSAPVDKSGAELNQANTDLRKRIEQAAGILKSLDQGAKQAKRAVPQASPILDSFSGLLMTKPPKHDGIAGGVFWRLSAVHWQLGQSGKQPAKAASPASVGGLPVDPAVASQVQAVKTIALTHKVHDDILKLRKSADEGLGKASKTLWGRNEKDSAIRLDNFHRESSSGLKRAAALLEEGMRAQAEAQRRYLFSLGKPDMGAGDVGIGGAGAKKRPSAEKAGGTGKELGQKSARVSQSEPGGSGSRALSSREASPAFGSGRDVQGLGRGGEGGKPEVARAPLAKKPLEADFHDWECLNMKEVSDLWGTIGFDKAWEKCQLISETCSNADAILGGRKKCYERELAGPSGDYFGCMDRAGVCQKKGAQPPAKPPAPPACQGMIVSGKCQACPAGQKPKAGGGCGPTCGGVLYDPAKTCCVGKSAVLLTKGKCTPKCGKNTYNPKAACCSAEGKLLANHIADSEGRCIPACGGKAYDKTKACCSVGKLLPGQLEVVPDKCGPPCGSIGHDPKKSVCCGGKQFNKTLFCCDGNKPLESQIRNLGQCAKRYKKADPKRNGCGGAAWYQRLGKEIVKSIINPDNPAGGTNTDFSGPCNRHDERWGTCKSDPTMSDAVYKEMWDLEFQTNMQRVCGMEKNLGLKTSCLEWARSYGQYVRKPVVGEPAYEASQMSHCRCCP